MVYQYVKSKATKYGGLFLLGRRGDGVSLRGLMRSLDPEAEKEVSSLRDSWVLYRGFYQYIVPKGTLERLQHPICIIQF